MMLKKTLKCIYRIVPSFLKNKVLSQIVKMEGGYMYSQFVRDVYKKKYNVEIGYGSYGGCFNRKNFVGCVEYGNYCSIAPNIKIFRANHPIDKFTTHPILYNPSAGYVKKDRLKRPILTVGHDVWIGEGATILPNVMSIGNGAVIGAGSVVTKNVPPYTIVVGNPAKIIKKRFSTEVIERLEELKWWNLQKEDLIKNIKEFEIIVNGK